MRTTDGENDTIVDVGTGRYVMINHKKKEYYEFTREEMLAAMRSSSSRCRAGGRR